MADIVQSSISSVLSMNPSGLDQPPPSAVNSQNNQDQQSSSSSSSKPTKVKRYHCSFCDRAFSRSEHRSRHERSHTKERPFHCPKCPSTFVRRDLLLRHDRTVHASHKTAGEPNHKRQSSAMSPLMTKSQASPNLLNHSVLIFPPSTPDSALDALATLVVSDPHSASESGQIQPQNSNSNHHPNNQTHDSVFNHNLNHNQNNVAEPGDRRSSRQHSVYDVALAMTNLRGTSSNPTRNNSTLHSRTSSEQMDGIEVNISMTQESPAKRNRLKAATTSASGSGRTALHMNNAALPEVTRDLVTPHFAAPQFNTSAPAAGGPKIHNNINLNWGADAGLHHHIPQFTSQHTIAHLVRFWTQPTGLDTDELAVPSKLMFNRFLSAYFNLFHPYLPFLHLQTFDVGNIAPSLVFAICSIGAQLCRDEPMAAALNSHSRLILSSIGEVNKDFPLSSNHAPPIWVTQSLLLCVVFASYSGDPRQLQFIRAERAFLANAAIASIRQQQAVKNEYSASTWSSWIQNELAKRTFFAVYRTFINLTAILDYPTPITNQHLEQLDLELPCSERLWATSFANEDEWRAQLPKEPASFNSNRVLSWLFDPTNTEYDATELSLGIFAMVVITSAVYIHQHLTVHDNASRHLFSVILKKWERMMHNEVDRNWERDSAITQYSYPLDSLYPAVLESPASFFMKHNHSHPLFRTSLMLFLLAEAKERNIDMTPIQDTFRYCVPQDTSSATVGVLNILLSNQLLRDDQIVPFIVRAFSVVFKHPLLCGMNNSHDELSMCITARIQDILSGMQLALVVIFWCFQMEQDLSDGSSRSRSNSIDNSSEESSRRSPTIFKASQSALEVFEAIEQLCIDSGVLDKTRSNGQTQERVSGALCLVYSEILSSVQNWGFASILGSAMKSVAYVFQSHRPSSNEGGVAPRFGLKRYSNDWVAATLDSNDSYRVGKLSDTDPRTSADPRTTFHVKPIVM